ncbi:hypothetical protein B566_EDAN008337 [Ephemera danica]|nr:hypothetical protein B566_EDAN008337 [Ephemera danica]
MKWSAVVFLLAALCLSQAKYVRFRDLKNIKVSGGAVTFKPEPEVKETVENTRDKLLEWDVALQTLNTSLVNWNDVIKDLVRPNFVDFAILLEHLQDQLVKIERNIQNAENVSWDDIETVHNNIRILSEFIQEPRERLVDLPQLCKYTTVFAEDLDKTVRMHHGHISSSVLVIDTAVRAAIASNKKTPEAEEIGRMHEVLLDNLHGEMSKIESSYLAYKDAEKIALKSLRQLPTDLLLDL